MNTLTKNRILQKGDEYRLNGEWKPVPKENFGLQVMFTPYKECRRPSEKPQVLQTIPQSRKAGQSDKIAAPRQAEKVKTPVPTPSGTGVTPYAAAKAEQDKAIAVKLAQTEREIEANGLPTVVSKKAHKTETLSDPNDNRGTKESPVKITRLISRETPETAKDAPTEVAKSPASPTPFHAPMVTIKPPTLPPAPVGLSKPDPKFGVGGIKIEYPPITKGPQPRWIGRNGTYNAKAVNIYRRKTAMSSKASHDDLIQIIPQGKRGEAKNALIEFPVSIIPDVIRFLEAHKA